MDRRTFLTVAGSATLAGCSGQVKENNGTNGTTTEQLEAADEGPPYFEQVGIEGPDEVTVGESFSLTVSVANTGGETGSFTAALSVGLGEQSIEIPDVESGTRKTKELGPYSSDYAQELTFKITEHAATKTIEVVPAELAVGDALQTDSIEATVSELAFRRSFFTGSGADTALEQAPEGQVYAFVKVENTLQGDQSGYLPDPQAFQLSSSEASVEPSDIGDVPVGEAYSTGLEQVSPGTTERGWIPFLVPDDQVTELEAQLDYGSDGVDARWQLSSEPSLPNPHISDVSVPENVTLFSNFTTSLTVENRGDAGAPVRALVSLAGEDDLGVDSVERINKSLAPGETTSVELELSPPGTETDRDETFNVAVHGTGESWEQTVQVVPPTFDLGETFTTPGELAVTVEEVVLGDVLETKAVFGDGWTENRIDDSKQWAFVRIASTNHGDTQPHALVSGFDIRSSEINNDPPIRIPSALDSQSEEFRGSISGSTYVPSQSAQSGESAEGWIVFKVPASLSRDELQIQWHTSIGRPEWNDLRAAAYWDI